MKSSVWWVLWLSVLSLMAGCGGGSMDDAGVDAPPMAMPDSAMSDAGEAVAVHASALGQAESFLLDERSLVWANRTQGSLQILDLSSSEVRTLATGIAGPDGALAMNATHVYWAGSRDGSLMRVARDGGASELLAVLPSSALPNGMAITDSHVYWTYFGGAVARYPLAGGTVEEIPWGTSMVGSPYIHGDYLYAAGSADVRRLRIGPEDDAALVSEWEIIATFDGPGGGPSTLIVEDGFVYGTITNESLLFRVPVGGGETDILASDLQPHTLAIEGDWLYMTGPYGVERMPLSGGTRERVVADSDSWGLAVGGGRIYWSTHQGVDAFDGTLKSIPTP
jgi:hypothetical protein